MNVNRINPYIRFCNRVSVDTTRESVYVRDCRIFYVTEGSGSIFIQNQHCHIKKDSLFFCRGGMEYAIDVEQSIKMYSVNFDLTQNKNTSSMALEPINADAENRPEPVDLQYIEHCEYLNGYLVLDNAIEFKSAMQEIMTEYRSKNIFYAEKCSALLKAMLTDIHRSSIAGTHDAKQAVDRVVKYIHNHYTHKIDNQQLAQLTGYHEYHLNRIFAKVTGSSIHQYILNLRMNHAENLVLNTDIAISTICEHAGFNNITHFSNYFKKTFGLSPAQYRAKFKGKV